MLIEDVESVPEVFPVVLKIRNDGKGKPYSFTVYSPDCPDTLQGYGSTRDEAVEDFKENLAEFVSHFTTIQGQVDDGFTVDEMVDYKGNKLN